MPPIDPGEAQRWSDEEVARRWLCLSRDGADPHAPLDARIQALAAQPERLGNLSWFMRFLKEPVARRANREDGCTGRFWESRFKVQALLEDAAVLVCMTYVDLNPVRAGLCARAETAPHTSLRRRMRQRREPDGTSLSPLATSIRSELPPLDLDDYRRLVRWTAGELHGDRPETAAPTPTALTTLGTRPQQWLAQVPATESLYWRAIGNVEALLERAQDTGRRWLCGLGAARRIERSAGIG